MTKTLERKKLEIAHDWLGNEIKVGTTVLYSISSSNYAKMVLAEVVEIWALEKPKSYAFRTFSLVCQPIAESGTRGIDINRGVKWHWSGMNGESWYEVVKPKLAYIQNVEKVTVYHKPEGFDDMVAAMIEDKVKKNNERLAARRSKDG